MFRSGKTFPVRPFGRVQRHVDRLPGPTRDNGWRFWTPRITSKELYLDTKEGVLKRIVIYCDDIPINIRTHRHVEAPPRVDSARIGGRNRSGFAGPWRPWQVHMAGSMEKANPSAYGRFLISTSSFWIRSCSSPFICRTRAILPVFPTTHVLTSSRWAPSDASSGPWS